MGTAGCTLGVEEEFLVVDAASGALRPHAPAALSAARDRLGEDVHPELHPSQIEITTPVAETLPEIRAERPATESAPTSSTSWPERPSRPGT